MEVEEECKDDVSEVTKQVGRQNVLCDSDSRDELANTKDGGPPLARTELAKQAEWETTEYGASVDGWAESDEAAELVTELWADTRRESQVHAARTLRVTNVSQLR